MFAITPRELGSARGPRWAGLGMGLLVLVALTAFDLFVGAWYARILVLGIAVAFAVFALRERARARTGMSRLRLLDQVARVADGSLELGDVLERITGFVVPDFADLCMIDVVHDGDVQRVAVRASGDDAAQVEERLRSRVPSLPDRFTDSTSETPEPFFTPAMDDATLREIAHDSGDLEFLRRLRPRSRIVVPLISRGRSLGTLTAIRTEPRARFATDDVGFAQVLAGRVSLVLDNAGLFSDLESVERRMDSVMESLGEAVVVHDGSGKLVYANPAATELIGFEGSDDLVSGATGIWDPRFDIRDEEGRPLDAETLPSRRALRGEESPPIVIRLFDRETGEESWRLERSTTIRGAAGEVLYAVMAIEDVTDVKRAEFAQRLLADAGQALSSSPDYTVGLRGLAATVVPRFADWCSVGVARPDGTIEQLAIAHGDPEQAALAERMVTRDLLETVAREGKHFQRLDRVGTASMLLEPIKVGDRVIGTFGLLNGPARPPFGTQDADLAEDLAGRIGLAILNAKLASERAEIAEALQRELLPPPLPRIPGWSLAGMYRPAGEQHAVGGDFYDVFEGRDGWVLAVGDVEGRGAEAAALTAMVRYTIRTTAKLQGDVEEALDILNQSLRSRSHRSLCSVACVTLSSERGVRVISAGHPLPLLVADGNVEEVGRPGSLLGALGDPDWEPLDLELSPGAQLVLYTDGVVEARGHDGRFGRERLGSMLVRVGDPREAVGRVEAALDRFAEPAILDDAALLVLKREFEPAEQGAVSSSAAQQAGP